MSNVNKGARVLGKAKKKKNMANKRSATKLVMGQPHIMGAKFAQLKALITSMVTQVKSNAYGSRLSKMILRAIFTSVVMLTLVVTSQFVRSTLTMIKYSHITNDNLFFSLCK
jgi:hypothetical protein